MYLLGKRADTLNEEDIKRLITSQIPESKVLDYKREIHLSKGKDKKEFLFDIAAMHNTDGGCIIFGIEELKDTNNQNTGKPEKVISLDIDNIDKLTQSIEDIVKGCTEPNISNLIINVIEVDSAKVLVLGIPMSIGLPAMVTFNQTNKFYKRRNSGKYPVDVYELNQVFMQNQILKEKINNFRVTRINEVISQNVFPNLAITTSFFIHIIPIRFMDNQILDFSSESDFLSRKMGIMNRNSWNKMYNLDGFATFTSSYMDNKIDAYSQVFRNGIYEVYTSNLFHENQHKRLGFSGDSFISETIGKIEEGLTVLNKLEVQPPFFVSFSFHNVREKVIHTERSYYTHEFKQNDILLPFIQIPTFDSKVYELLKPNFDILWQSLGFSKSPDYK